MFRPKCSSPTGMKALPLKLCHILKSLTHTVILRRGWMPVSAGSNPHGIPDEYAVTFLEEGTYELYHHCF